MAKNQANDFARLAAGKDTRFASELWLFLKRSRKWWLLPLVITLVVFSVLVYLSGSAAAPFIYTLF